MTILEESTCKAIIRMAKNDEPDYWTKLEHQYAGMAMQGFLASGEQEELYESDIVADAILFARLLVEKLKKEESK